MMAGVFRIARNPDPDSTLPYLLWVPIGPEPLVLKAKDTWPRTAKVYCHRGEWPDVMDGSLLILLGELATARRAAIVVEDRWAEAAPSLHTARRPASTTPAQLCESSSDSSPGCSPGTHSPTRTAPRSTTSGAVIGPAAAMELAESRTVRGKVVLVP